MKAPAVLEPHCYAQKGDDYINTSRTKKLSLRLSEKEYKRITRRAKSCGLTKSAYVRQLIIGYEPRESPPADYFAMTRELKEIGNNMNQLAFMANATGLIDEATYYENVIHLRDSLLRIEESVVGKNR
ncbi:plasmid mobilization protein [Acutalibacter sp. 1XD8-33]|uniref:plasmid mobilization protein n=1 Tax=Acutalibacter sp. 1XD8-33 TaxID=2320081 RepID=UPI001FA982BE|nr:plasmid mobilization relaxosome protein MobC [Acutalibacter sp. 1XD8-33]